MSIADQTSSTNWAIPPTVPIPRLQNGDRLTSVEFERRYNAMPGVNKAELIEGTVYMPSPVRHSQHGQPHAVLISWLGYFASKAPGVELGDNCTVRLDQDNQPQPDAVLLLPPHAGSTATIDREGYIAGAPDLVCEIAASTVSIDLHDKKHAYRRNGVREYLVVRTEDHAVDWFEVVGGDYQPKSPDDRGRLRSQLFPGLWLDTAALLASDLPKLFAAIDQGVDTDEHRALLDRLASKPS